MKDEAVAVSGFECRVISNPGRRPCIVLLHGYNYTSDVWNDIGLLRLLEQKGIAFKAVDMPYSRTSESTPRSQDPAQNAGILARLAPADVLLVGASLGGYIALKHCVAHPAAGLMVISPVMSLRAELAAHYSRLSMQVSIIYGAEDNVVHIEEMRRLAGLLNTEVKIYENAEHAAYIDQPERFRNDVIAFHESIARSWHRAR